MTATAFLAAWGAFVAIAWAPGPAVLATAHRAMASGFGAAARLALGLAVGVTLWGFVAAAGLGAVLAASEQALAVLRLAGGAYLVWLALRAARAAVRRMPTPDAVAAGFRAGLLLNLANPKVVLAWMAVLSLAGGAGPAALLLLVAACGASALAGYLLWAALLSRGAARAAYARGRRLADCALAALLGLAGAELIRLSVVR